MASLKVLLFKAPNDSGFVLNESATLLFRSFRVSAMPFILMLLIGKVNSVLLCLILTVFTIVFVY